MDGVRDGVLEQHCINAKGGLRKLNPASPLENRVLAIDADSFRRFRQGVGHNPCAT